MSAPLIDGRLRWAQALSATASGVSLEEIGRRLDATPVAIVVGADKAATLAAQTLALTAVNLLARLFRRLIVVAPQACPVDGRLPFIGDGDLGPALAAFARRIHRDVTVELASTPPSGAVTLAIAAAAPAGPSCVHCWGGGWHARVARRPLVPPRRSSDPRNPVGPLVAAALGVAEVFKLVFGDVIPTVIASEEILFSALTYRVGQPDDDPPVGQIALPDTTLVGVGSIGSAFLWGLAHLRQARGRLAIVDPDRLAPHNPDRAILTLDDAAERALAKATWARDAAAPWAPDLAIEAFDGTIREYVDTLAADYQLPLALAAVDSIVSRRDIQDALPRRILNASTGPTRVDLSRHGFADGRACLYCLYLPQVLKRSPIHIAVERTGFPEKMIAEYMIEGHARLSAEMVRGIEKKNELPAGTLRRFVGRRLPELLEAIAYSQAPIPTAGGQALVTTAFVSALAGFLLLAETIKEGVPALAPFRLEREYGQDLLGVPNEDHYWSRPDGSGYCLCADPLRRQLYRSKYG